MRTQHEATVTGHIDAGPAVVFGMLTNVDRLPEWNAHIDHVVEPCSDLVGAAEWVVHMRVLGSGWDSRSQLRELDRDELRFTHRTQSDDGNPSYALWTWQVAPSRGGADVTVSWQLNPKTFWRKTLLAHVRQRQLRNEVEASLGALNDLLHAPAPAHDQEGNRTAFRTESPS